MCNLRTILKKDNFSAFLKLSEKSRRERVNARGNKLGKEKGLTLRIIDYRAEAF